MPPCAARRRERVRTARKKCPKLLWEKVRVLARSGLKRKIEAVDEEGGTGGSIEELKRLRIAQGDDEAPAPPIVL